jgi:hypothetical protein
MQLPNEVILERDVEKGKAYDRAYVQTSWPERIPSTFGEKDSSDDKGGGEQKLHISLSVHLTNWEYDGCFQKLSKHCIVDWATRVNQPRPIQEMSMYPLRYAAEGTLQDLMERGEKFWDCRYMKYVSYTGWDFNRAEQLVSFNFSGCALTLTRSFQTDVRFMIDITTYKKMHADSAVSKRHLRDDLGPEAMAQDAPPGENFLLLLPPSILGFNMQEKKWSM